MSRVRGDGRAARVFCRWVLALAWCLAAVQARADDYADYVQAGVDLQAAHDRIRLDEAAVGQVLREALDAKYGEFQAWEAVDRKMEALGQGITASRETMTRSAATLLRMNPTYRLPEVNLGRPFDGNLELARRKKREWVDLANRERGKLQALNRMQAKVNEALLRANRELVGDTMEGFLPDEKQLAGEAGVIVLGAYFGPPGLATAGLVYGGVSTFNSMINLYYGAGSLAAQAKVLTGMREVLARRQAEVEQSLAVLTDAVREIQQVEALLDSNRQRMEEFRRELMQTADGLDSQARAALQAEQDKRLKAAREAAASPRTAIPLETWIFGMTPIPTLQPAEWAGEADALARDLESYARAVEDGGDPDVYFVRLSDGALAIQGKIPPLQAEYDRKMAAYREAAQAHSTRYWAAAQRYSAASQALWDAYRNRRVDDAYYAAAARIGETYNQEVRASENQLRPFGQAMIAPYRELVRLRHILAAVEPVEQHFTSKVELAVYFRSGEFWREYSQWTGRVEAALGSLTPALARIPTSFSVYLDAARGLEEGIPRALAGSDNVEVVRNVLLQRAEVLRKAGQEAREGYQDYQARLAEARQVLNAGESEMRALLTRYDRSINYPRAGRFHICWWCAQAPFEPDAAETAARQQRLAAYVQQAFRYEEPAYAAEAARADWDGLADRYAAKAEELKTYVDWADQYRFRVNAALARLARIRATVTPPDLDGAGVESPDAYLRREFGRAPWAVFGQEAERFVDAAAYERLPYSRAMPRESLLPWQKLYTGQTLLLERVRTDMRSYVQSKTGTGYAFSPVREELVAPIEAQWRDLRAVCARFDVLAAATQSLLATARDDTTKAAQPVLETWAAMPALSQRLVADERQRFQQAHGWLESYLARKGEQARTLLAPPTNSVAVQLDELVQGYRPGLAEWKARVEREARAAEAARREYEAAEQARIAAEAARLAEEKRLRDAFPVEVRQMYEQFRQAYEARDEAGVLRLLADGWEAGDGTSVSDLGAHLRRMFGAFDEVRIEITNLQVQEGMGGRMVASYDLAIVSRIFSLDLRHRETSSVREEVGRDRQGRMRILRTLGGRFWNVE
jgi:hypothetical protein